MKLNKGPLEHLRSNPEWIPIRLSIKCLIRIQNTVAYNIDDSINAVLIREPQSVDLPPALTKLHDPVQYCKTLDLRF